MSEPTFPQELVFLLEEQSAQVMLEGLLPRLSRVMPTTRYIVFDGKRDLDRHLVGRIRGYRNPRAIFFVMRDLDLADDCLAVKERLLAMCAEARRPNAIVRLACRELESFYLADLAAVGRALGLGAIAARQRDRKFADPDRIGSPSRERATLTKGAYQKVGGSREIGRHLDVENDRSPSFKALVQALRRILATFESGDPAAG